MRRPFYLADKKAWYIKDESGSRHRLHQDKDEAHRIWRRMTGATDAGAWNETFRELAEAFLEHFELIAKPARYSHVGNFIGKFAESIPVKRLWREVSKTDVLRWLAKQHEWSDTYKHDAGATICQVFNWAVKNQKIDFSPLVGLELPSPKSRTVTIDRSMHIRLIEQSRKDRDGKPFALLLIALWNTGARPQSICNLEEKNIHQGGAVWVFPDHKTKKKTNRPQVIYPSPCAQTLVKILLTLRSDTTPGGKVFRNGRGRRWLKDTICQRFRRTREKLKIGEEYTIYAYRHGFATTALLAGQKIATVSQLLGHTDTRMVSAVYGHLEQHAEFLAGAVGATVKERMPAVEEKKDKASK